MRASEKLAFEWLTEQYPNDKVYCNPNDPPDFVLESDDGKKVYAEVTGCGWLTYKGEDDRGPRKAVEKIIREEVKNARENLGLFDDTFVSIMVMWPHEFIPKKRNSVARKLIAGQVREYGEHLKSCKAHGRSPSEWIKGTIPLGRERFPAELYFHERRPEDTEDKAIVNVECVGSLEPERYISTIKKALQNKTTQEVKNREGGFSEYWLVLVDESAMLMGDDHKSSETWRSADWALSKEGINKGSDASYWDRIVLASDYNGYLEHLDILRRIEVVELGNLFSDQR